MLSPSHLDNLADVAYILRLLVSPEIPLESISRRMKDLLNDPSFPTENLLYPLMERRYLSRENYEKLLRDDFLRSKIIECLRQIPSDVDHKLDSVIVQLRTSPEYTDVLGAPEAEASSLSMRSHRRRRRGSYKAKKSVKKSRKTSSRKNRKNRSRK
jgi:hypothetical protein